jgi:hypothetical protein
MKFYFINVVISIIIFFASYYLIEPIYIYLFAFGFFTGIGFDPNYEAFVFYLRDNRILISSYLVLFFLLSRLIRKK